jgi:hypothetical protein
MRPAAPVIAIDVVVLSLVICHWSFVIGHLFRSHAYGGVENK